MFEAQSQVWLRNLKKKQSKVDVKAYLTTHFSVATL